MADMTKAKFVVRVIFTAAIMIIGAVIFFTSEDTGNQVLGTNMITVGWATWMSAGKAKKGSGTPETPPAQAGGPVGDVEDPLLINGDPHAD
jgi:hypothetical protein